MSRSISYTNFRGDTVRVHITQYNFIHIKQFQPGDIRDSIFPLKFKLTWCTRKEWIKAAGRIGTPEEELFDLDLVTGTGRRY